MHAIKTVDTRGLEHAEKERLVFPGIEALQADETLRIVLDFNPVPLEYLLKAYGKYEVAKEKEGPDEWILRVRRIAPPDGQKEQLRALLRELKEGEVSAETRAGVKTLLESVDAKTLGVMEEELVKEGVGPDAIRKGLCDIHLEVLRDSLVAKRQEVSAPHPVHTLMEEHKVIVNSLHELRDLLERLKARDGFSALGEDLEKLQDIAHHLVEAESHHQREEEALFPELEKHGIAEPPKVMKIDHEEFRKRKRKLYQAAHNYQDYDFPRFRDKVLTLGEYLVEELESHIFKEDNIIYQIALQTLNPEEWEAVKKSCDKIGYCCFTPEDQKREE